MIGYKYETAIVLEQLDKIGLTPTKAGHWYTNEDLAHDSEHLEVILQDTEGLTRTQQAEKAYQWDDTILWVVSRDTGRYHWLRLTYGNSFGELVSDWDGHYIEEINDKVLGYDDYYIDELLSLLGVSKTLEELVEQEVGA